MAVARGKRDETQQPQRDTTYRTRKIGYATAENNAFNA